MARRIGVCSWSLQVSSVPELARLVREVGAESVQIGLGDPNHGSWDEGPDLARALEESGLVLSGAMIGFPGEDYTSPETIRRTGGFGNLETRAKCLEIFRSAVDRTAELGLEILLSHAGFIPDLGDPARAAFLDTIREAGEHAASKGVTFAMETGQETADLLRETLDELSLPSVKVNFDPANMILYDMGDPIRAIEILGPDIVHVHAKDARPPKAPGAWGEEVPLGEGVVDLKAFLAALDGVGFAGTIAVEREVGTQAERVLAIRQGIERLRRIGA